MVWNEKLKRGIPEGWGIKPLNEIVKVIDGTHDSPKQQNEGYFLITSKHLLPTGIDFKTAYYISEEDYMAINKRSKVDTYDILFSMIGTIGNKYLVSEETVNFAIKNIALIKSSENEKIMYFLWFYLSSPDYIRYEHNAISGSIQKFLSLDAMRNIPILFDEKILTLFNKSVSKICKLISNTNNENILLTKQRDELLPLLMNGQVSFKSLVSEERYEYLKERMSELLKQKDTEVNCDLSLVICVFSMPLCQQRKIKQLIVSKYSQPTDWHIVCYIIK